MKPESYSMSGKLAAELVCCPICRAVAGEPCTAVNRVPHRMRARLSRWLRDESIFTYPEHVSRLGFDPPPIN